jgi:GET complex subunit GET2
MYFFKDRPVPGTRASAVDSFVGDAGDMPLPISRKPSATRPHTARKASSASASDTSTAADPTIWTHEQQEQFMRALMGSGLAGPPSSASTLVGDGGGSDRLTSASQDPLAALMASLIPNTSDSSSLENTVVSSFTQPGSNPIPSPSGVAATPKSRSLVLRLLPLLHLASAFGLLLSFIYSTLSTSADQWTGGSRWAHWADLRWGKSDMLASQRTVSITAFGNGPISRRCPSRSLLLSSL